MRTYGDISARARYSCGMRKLKIVRTSFVGGLSVRNYIVTFLVDDIRGY